MKFLLIAAAFPYPADSGGKLRSIAFLKHMSAMGEVHLVTFCTRQPSDEELRYVRQYCRTVQCIENSRGFFRKALDLLRSVVTGVPYLVLANRCPQIAEAAAATATASEHGIDLIQVEELFMTGNLDLVRRSTPVVLDAHNAEASVQKRLCAIARNPLERIFYALQTSTTSRFEIAQARAVDAVFCVSPEDLAYFTQLANRAIYVPNGIDSVAESKARRAETVLFTGTLQYPPNRDALEWLLNSIWPRVSSAVPTASLQIIARNPPEELIRSSTESVSFLSEVDNIEPYYSSAQVMAVPLRAGGGTRFKVLHAFAHGLPVVSTRLGAEGLPVNDGEHLALRDDEEPFADALISLLRDPAQREQLSDSARQLVVREFLWSNIFRTCTNAYTQLAR